MPFDFPGVPAEAVRLRIEPGLHDKIFIEGEEFRRAKSSIRKRDCRDLIEHGAHVVVTADPHERLVLHDNYRALALELLNEYSAELWSSADGDRDMLVMSYNGCTY